MSENRPSRLCCVRQLSRNTTEESLRRHFKDVAAIQEIEMKKREDGTCKGLAYISFVNHETAVKAANLKHETRLDGRFIDVTVVSYHYNEHKKQEDKKEPKENYKPPKENKHHHHRHHKSSSDSEQKPKKHAHKHHRHNSNSSETERSHKKSKRSSSYSSD